MYELKTLIKLDTIEDSEGTDLDKIDKSKEYKICHYNCFDNGFKSDSKTCSRWDWSIKSFRNFAIIHVNDFSYIFFMFDMTEEDVIEFIKDFEPDDELKTTLQYERIDTSKRINTYKTTTSKEYMFCHYWYFKDVEFKFKSNICNECCIRCIYAKT